MLLVGAAERAIPAEPVLPKDSDPRLIVEKIKDYVDADTMNIIRGLTAEICTCNSLIGELKKKRSNLPAVDPLCVAMGEEIEELSRELKGKGTAIANLFGYEDFENGN